MPLLKGKSNIGHNVREMEAHGHSKAQSVAAALSTAYDKEELFNTMKKNEAAAKGAIMSHDDSYAKPVTAMSIQDINQKNEKLWGNVGPAETQATAPELAGTRVSRNVPVYTGAGIGDEGAETKKPKWSPEEVIRQQAAAVKKNPNEAKRIKEGKWRGEFAEDEVQPTQSDPPDDRSDNLLGATAVAGEHDAKEPSISELSGGRYATENKEFAAMRGKKIGQTPNRDPWENQYSKKSGDDLAMNTESMPPEGQADAAPKTDLEKQRAAMPKKEQAAARKEDRAKQGAAWNKEHERVMGSEAHGMRGRS